MKAQLTGELYRQVIAITEEYLGPAAERFTGRLISFHLNKAPQELVAEDLPILIDWAKVTLALLTKDRKLVEEYTMKLKDLVP